MNHLFDHNLVNYLEREVKVIKFRGDPSRMSGIIEVRGIVNKDGTISYGEFTQYDNEFGKQTNHFNPYCRSWNARTHA